MRFNIKEIIKRDLSALRGAKILTREVVDDFSLKNPKIATVLRAIAVVLKWFFILIILAYIIAGIYYLVITRPQDIREEKAAIEQRKTLEYERTRSRRECLEKLRVPDTGQILGIYEIVKCREQP